MSTALHLVYQYQRLTAKCASSAGLDIDEIEALSTVEALFAKHDHSADTDLWSCRREFTRERVSHRAILRGPRHSDPVTIVNLGPGGVVCNSAPYVKPGTIYELIINDHELSLSYRFKAVVLWRRDQPDGDYTIGMRLMGAPLLVHHGESRPARAATEPGSAAVAVAA